MLKARFIDSLTEVSAAQWDALRPDDNPFLAHAFLVGLEVHGCLQRENGWLPHHLLIDDGDQLVAAAPCYLKGNSHGEFVFDHAWANAYWRHGLDYYPKLLCGVPYSPVAGPRLLTGAEPRPELRTALLKALAAEAQRTPLSSAHINFDQSASDRTEDGWLRRFDWQFHWNRGDWSDFDQFLAALSSKKRKNIRQERAAVQRAGIRFRWLHGDEASEADLLAMHDFYQQTFREKGNLAVLTLAFLRHLAQSMPRQMLMIIAYCDDQPLAGALLLRSKTTLYGRYWGSAVELPGLHFETCYYQGIEYCLQNGLARFEPGAQGEHKLARGFLPTATHSLHYIVDPRFRAAIGDSLEREAAALEGYRSALMQHSPYRAPMSAD